VNYVTTTETIRTCVENAERQVRLFSQRTVDTFATCDFNFRMQKYAQCGPRLSQVGKSTKNYYYYYYLHVF